MEQKIATLRNSAEVFSRQEIEKLIELGKHAVLVRLHNQRRAFVQRSILKAVDRYLHDSPTSLGEAVQAAARMEMGEMITDTDIAAYLRSAR